jgi:hypothetical protein
LTKYFGIDMIEKVRFVGFVGQPNRIIGIRRNRKGRIMSEKALVCEGECKQAIPEGADHHLVDGIIYCKTCHNAILFDEMSEALRRQLEHAT